MQKLKTLITHPYVSSTIFLILLLAAACGMFILAILAVVLFPISIPTFLLIRYTPINKHIQRIYYSAYDYVFYKSEKPRKLLWGLLYDWMCTYYPLTRWRAMNYGYAVLNESGKTLSNLDEQQEQERFCLQLYHYAATNLWKYSDLKGLKVLEIGSGRGGGLCYITQHLEPAVCYGVDYSQKQVEFCRSTYNQIDNLHFQQGDSENLQILNFNQQFDLVINIESSHCYGNFKKFVGEVTAQLKSGGVFVIADFRAIEEIPKLEEELTCTGLKLISKEDITINVQHAMKLDEKRKSEWINANSNIIMRPFFRKFSGLSNTRIYKEFSTRKSLYMVYSLRKN